MTEENEKVLPEILGKKNPALPLAIIGSLCFMAGIIWSYLDPGCTFSDGQLTVARWILGILCFFSCGEASFVSIRNQGLEKNKKFDFWEHKLCSFLFAPMVGFVVFLFGRGIYWIIQNLDESWWGVKDWLSASFIEIFIIAGVIIILILFFIQNKKGTLQKFGKERTII